MVSEISSMIDEKGIKIHFLKHIFSFTDQILKKQTKNRPILEKSLLLTDPSREKQTELGTLLHNGRRKVCIFYL